MPRQPQINTIVAGYEVDAEWPAHRLVAEHYYHDFEADRAKDADLVEAGLRSFASPGTA